MRTRALGPSGIQASTVAFGAWAIGGWMWGGADEAQAVAAIQAGIDAGMTFIDTAPMYGYGKSEELVGKAIRGRRDQVVLATKCGLRWDTAKGSFRFHADELGLDVHHALKYKIHIYLGPEGIREELERSLTRLGTDHVDLYQTHWQDPTTPIADAMGELLKLKAQGKIRAIGVCNATPAHMDAYRALGPLDADQEKYSMLDRGQEASNLPYTRQAGMAVLAYSPLANGLLTGAIGPERTFGPGDLRTTRPRFSQENRQRVAALLDEIRPIAIRHGLTLGQLAIAWTLAQPGVTHALVGARDPKQSLENAKAGDATLPAEDLAAIAAALAGRRDIV